MAPYPRFLYDEVDNTEKIFKLMSYYRPDEDQTYCIRCNFEGTEYTSEPFHVMNDACYDIEEADTGDTYNGQEYAIG